MALERVKVGHITFHELKARDVDSARQEILNFVQRTSYGSTIYFDGYNGLGTTAVLRSIAQVRQSMKDHHQELQFRRIIYIDCSSCKSKRVMQKRIAEELKLSKTMAMFEKQDEEDDFNGVDPASRDSIRDVAVVIDRTLRETSFVMVFLNGSDEEVVLNRLGVPEFHDYIIIWTFKKRFPTRGLLNDESSDTILDDMPSKLRNTDIFVFMRDDRELTSSELSALVHEDAASILIHHPCMRGDDRVMVIDCYLYVLFLHRSFYKGRRWIWAAHGANYWIYDGIIQGARTREISKALYQEVNFESDGTPFGAFLERRMRLHTDSSYLCFYDDGPSWTNGNRTRHWISITSENMISSEDTKSILPRASSVVLSFEITTRPQGLPDDLIEECRNLRVLILSNCAFNFSSPLFGHCSTLRFLGLDHCINNDSTKLPETEDYTTKWACLSSLWVLDLRYTYWDEILSERKMDLMGNIMELNIEGSICWQYTTGKLEGRLPYLQRLRIVKPLHQAVETSMEIDNSFVGQRKLQVLDLSGNKDMKNLPTSLSQATSLEVLVIDGCDGLENVVLSNSSLRSFSFDGYGPASNWTSMDDLPLQTSRPKCTASATDDDKKGVKTSLITLEGCTQLRNLFLRGLPNLVELDLSGCAIKILDFETMVMDVLRLKRLFLLGCKHLCAIRWGPPTDTVKRMTMNLGMLCIDTRPGDGVSGHTRQSIVQQPIEHFGLQVHVVTADARLARSLWPLIYHHTEEAGELDCFFDIRITSSNIICSEKTSEEHHVVVASPYDDVSTKFGDSFITPIEGFPQPPASRSDRHIEIGDGSCNVGSEMEVFRTSTLNLFPLMARYVESLHVHDTSTSVVMPSVQFESLEWCRVERCSRLDPVFPPADAPPYLETIWASDLPMARCIWSKDRQRQNYGFAGLQHLHLRLCPSLQFALPVWTTSFHMLKTLHIMHCGSLKHVFALNNKDYDINNSIWFPELTTIHLHDVPSLWQICEIKMITPKLKTIRSRGCWNLRRLPALEGRGQHERRPTVEMEKDVWDALEWNGVDVGHQPSLYEACLHSRYYKRRGFLRGTVLR